MIFKAVSAILGDLLKSISQFLIGKRAAFGKEVAEIEQDLFDGFDIAFVAIDKQFISSSSDIYIEQRF